MAGKPAFHLFGFPIHVRPGFLMFMVLVVFIHGDEFGLWLAGSAAVLTLLHELGHAFAARATGAEAEIALDFLAGYASFVPVRPLKRWERAGISIAGPAVQILVSIGILLVLGAHPWRSDPFNDSAAVYAIRWTGPVMGLFNLVPVLPLDGGNIAQAGLDLFLPGRSRTPMLWFSVALTAAMAVWLFTNPEYRNLGLFVVFPLMIQIQMLGAGSSKPTRRTVAGSDGEATAWRTGEVQAVPEDLLPSPWFRAHQQVQQGHPDTGRSVLVADFASDEPPDWWPPEAASVEDLRALVSILPHPMPTGRPYSELVLTRVLARIGDHEGAVRYGAASFATTRSSSTAVVVACSAAALGSSDTTYAWLRAALEAGTDLDAVARAIDGAPEIQQFRDEERFVRLRATLEE